MIEEINAGGRGVRPTLRALTATVLLLVLVPSTCAFAQSGPPQPASCSGASDVLTVTATVRPPRAVLEIELALRNASPAPIRIDPARFALFNDQGEQFAPLSAEQARQLIRNPALDLWGWFWFGTSGSEVGIGVGVTTQASQEVDLRILRAVDLTPGATLRGSVYFRSPHPQVNLFILSLDGLTGGTDTPLAPVRLTCDVPRAAATSGSVGAAKLVPLNARAAAGPVAVSVSGVSFAKDFTTLMVSVENSATVEAGLFAALLDARLTDDAGKTYAVRLLRSDVPDRVPARGTVRGRLVFEPLPFPPALRSARLTLPEIRVGDAVYEIALDLRF